MSDGSRPPTPLPYRLHRDASAQTETIGAVILLGITVIGTVGIVAFGSIALNDTEQRMEVRAAEHTMTQMNAQFAEVALGQADSKTAQLPPSDEDATTEVVDSGWIRLQIVNQSSGSVESTIFNKSLGAVVYENGDTEIGYQGGGVWKKSGGNSTMVSAPEFHFRGETLTLPVVQVDGDGQVDDEITIGKNGTATQLYPNSSEGFSNPFTAENKSINVTVGSEYYEAWGDFFQTRTDGRAYLDHDNGTVTLEMVAEVEQHTVSSGIGATAAGGTLQFKGAGNDETFVDSYNSSKGPYSLSKGWNGTVVAAGSVDIGGNAVIRGNIRTGGGYKHKGAADVHGDVYWTDYYNPPGSGGGPGGGPGGGGGGGGTHNGTDVEISGVDSQPPIDNFVQEQVNESRASNDNDDHGVIDDERLDFDGLGLLPGTLTNGTYYLEDLTVPSGETLVLDTVGGNITIGVRDYVDVDGDVEVQGPGRVQIYVAGESTAGGTHLDVDGGTVDVGADDQSTQLWVFGKRTFSAEFDGGATFQGVIYAPSTSEAENPGEVVIGDADVYGGIISGTTEFGPGSTVHFDEALTGVQAVPEDTTVVLVNYLQVTVNVVDIDD